MALVSASSVHALDLNQFTPDSAIIGYSVYTTSYVRLPSNSGLANGGLFGTAGNIDFGDGMMLRAPRINVGNQYTVGVNTTFPKTWVGANLAVGSGTLFSDTLQVFGNLVSGSTNLKFNKAVGIQGNLGLSGSQVNVNDLLRLGGTYSAPGMTFGAVARVEMAAAAGGPTAPGGTSYNVPWSPLLSAPDLVTAQSDLPAYAVAGYAPPATRPNIDLSTPANTAADAAVQFLSPALVTAYYWKCDLGVPFCKGDTLQPGYYGDLTVTGNARALLLTEGFYSFTSIAIGGGNAIIAAQNNGGRTVVYSEGNFASSSSNGFIGPDSARLATGFGDSANQFLGGTMMVASAGRIDIPSDIRIWATLTAPRSRIHFSSQVTLFGQAFADTLIGDNMIDFGKGAFIPFRGLVPALFAPGSFSVSEKVDPACADTSGLPCRDTVLTIRLPYTTAYTVRARYRIVETSPRGATIDKDFPYDTGTVVIAPGDTTFDLRVRVYDDSSYEAPETFRIVFDSLRGAGCPDASGNADTTIKSCDAVGTILDDDRAPRVRIDADSAVHEGDSGTRPIRFVVRLIDPVSGQPLDAQNAPEVWTSFHRRTADATATVSDSDYAPFGPVRDSLPFQAVSDTFSVLVRGDTRHERDEWFSAILDSLVGIDSTGSVLSDSGWILDDDSAPGVRIGDVSIQEPATYGDTAWAVFPVTLSRASGLPVVLQIASADSSARSTMDPISGIADYNSLSNTATIPADSTGILVRIPVFGDTLHEGTEFFKVLLLSATDAVLDDSIGVGTIVDADSAPAISIDTAWVVEPTTGERDIVFRVHLTRPSGLPASITLQVDPGTATSNIDYKVAYTTSMALRAGLRDTVFRFPVLADSIAGEGIEDLHVAITFHGGLQAGILTATGYIVDAQGLPMVSIADAAVVTEGDTARFLVSMDYHTAKRATVRWRFAKGTADSADVTAYAGEIVFEPGGSRSATIAIPTVVDTVWEPTETFAIELDSCVACRIGDASGLGTILEEGEVPRIEFLNVDTTVVEDRAGTLLVVVGLTRAASIPLSSALLLDPTSTATRNVDWSLPGLSDDSLRFAAGSRRVELSMPIVPDTLEESTETVILSLSPSAPLLTGAHGAWTLSIIDDDHRPVVDITRPIDSLRTNVPVHEIGWTVDGVPQTSVDTTLSEGWNRIVRTYVDTFGHVASDTHMVWGDFTPPEVHVFKIVGPNPLHPERDTTWWGDRARTRFGVDTIWYWVRDSAKQDDGSWKVFVDTLVAVTDFSGDGVFPTEVKACDDVGNCGVDTGWIDLKQSIPVVVIDNPKDGHKVKPGDVPVDWHVDDAGKHHEFKDVEKIEKPGIHVLERCWTDDVGNTGCDTTHPVADTSRILGGKYVDLDHDGRIDGVILTLDVPWMLDSLPEFEVELLGSKREGLKPDTSSSLNDATHMLVPVVPPFDFGITGFADDQPGFAYKRWKGADGVEVVVVDSFAIADGVPPVIVDAEVRRVENYVDPDTVWIKPSEPVLLDPDSVWIEVGTCPIGRDTCAATDMTWTLVPVEDIEIGADGRLRVLVQPGDSGSVRPGLSVRFREDVTDTLGNRVDVAPAWSTVVRGGPRPDLIKVEPPTRIPVITTSEQDRNASGGILIRASKGNDPKGEWWEPGRGYLGDNDPSVQDVCPDMDFCNGPRLYINRPVRMVLYIYDLAGTYAISRTIDITQKDIDELQGDKIDRLYITLEWNHRSDAGQVVGTGVYVWRIIAQTHDRGETSGIQNLVWRTGVKVPRK